LGGAFEWIYGSHRATLTFLTINGHIAIFRLSDLHDSSTLFQWLSSHVALRLIEKFDTVFSILLNVPIDACKSKLADSFRDNIFKLGPFVRAAVAGKTQWTVGDKANPRRKESDR
jgi:hypothetical protein